MDQLGLFGHARTDHAKWKGKANGDASNAQTFLQPDRGKSLVVRRVGWTEPNRVGRIAGFVWFDRLGEAPYR